MLNAQSKTPKRMDSFVAYCIVTAWELHGNSQQLLIYTHHYITLLQPHIGWLQHSLVTKIRTFTCISIMGYLHSVLSWSLHQQVSLLKPSKSFKLLLLVLLVTHAQWPCENRQPPLSPSAHLLPTTMHFISLPMVLYLYLQFHICTCDGFMPPYLNRMSWCSQIWIWVWGDINIPVGYLYHALNITIYAWVTLIQTNCNHPLGPNSVQSLLTSQDLVDIHCQHQGSGFTVSVEVYYPSFTISFLLTCFTISKHITSWFTYYHQLSISPI